jgi:Ca-activated chloride channel family protein
VVRLAGFLDVVRRCGDGRRPAPAQAERGMIALLVTLLLAAPEKVTIVARKDAKPDLLDHAASAAGSAWHRLFEKEDPQVGEGNALAAQGDTDGALKQYDAARERLQENPALQFDRSSALLKSGDAAKAPEAASEAAQALQHGEGALKAKAAYDLALATESMGRADEAIKAYAAALALDPQDEDSKVNLELLLKQEERKKQQQQQQQQDQNKQKDQKDQQQQQQQQQSQQQEDQKKETPKEEQNQQQPQQQAKQEEKKQEQKPEEKQVDRTEAERLLDALRAGEKNLQSWRFAKEKRKETHRGEVERDW